MTDLIEDYLHKVEQVLGGDPAWRAEIVGELRSHLREKVADLARANPDWETEGIHREVIRDFGSPKDLALAYAPETGTVVRSRATGEVMLRIPATAAKVGHAIGKGTKRAAENTSAFFRSPAMMRHYDALPAFLQAVARGVYRLLSVLVDALATLIRGISKVVGKALVVVLVLAVVVLTLGTVAGVILYDDVVTFIEANEYHEVYEETLVCMPAPCSQSLAPQTFSLHDNAKEFHFVLRAQLGDANNGTATVRVIGPDGGRLLDRTIGDGSPVPHRLDLTWSPEPGDYTVEYLFDGAFQGQVEVDVWTRGVPRGSLPVPQGW